MCCSRESELVDDRAIRDGSYAESAADPAFARKNTAHVALRTCIATRKVKPSTELLRCVAQHSDDGTTRIVTDLHGRLPGRGAWLSPTAEALEKAIEQRRFHRALRLGSVTTDFDELWAVLGREGSEEH